jgi:cyanate permease
MGLLDKTNPRATCWTVLRHAFVVGLVAALLYLVAVFWEGPLREHWVIGLCVWTCLCALVGGLWEWQVRREDGENEDV